MECSEVLRIVNFRTIFFLRVLMYYLLDVNNVGVRMKERRHNPHDFSRRGRRGGMIFIYPRKEGREDIGKSAYLLP